MTVARYVTLCRVKLGGVDFAIDTPIALSPDVAQPLLATKSIAAQAGAIPAMPTVLGDPVRDVIDLQLERRSAAPLHIRARMGGWEFRCRTARRCRSTRGRVC